MKYLPLLGASGRTCVFYVEKKTGEKTKSSGKTDVRSLPQYLCFRQKKTKLNSTRIHPHYQTHTEGSLIHFVKCLPKILHEKEANTQGNRIT